MHGRSKHARGGCFPIIDWLTHSWRTWSPRPSGRGRWACIWEGRDEESENGMHVSKLGNDTVALCEGHFLFWMYRYWVKLMLQVG